MGLSLDKHGARRVTDNFEQANHWFLQIQMLAIYVHFPRRPQNMYLKDWWFADTSLSVMISDTDKVLVLVGSLQ